ncbi:MAG: hypothetical protein WCE46_08690 [Methanoregula sp.]|uniref:hypothetical protein n=1 Tax=Methanoregula sp. TaxID=2052170 RepID=UPI003C7684C7
MNARTFLIPCICAVLLIALVLPAGADDTAQVTTVAPTDNVTVASPPAFDPFGAIEGIIGLRHEDRNLTQDINANDQQIHQNWWDNINIFSSILGNREAVRSDQQADLANRTQDIGYREDIHAERQDMRNDSGNQSADQQQIAGYRADISQDRQDINTTHEDIRDERNASAEDRAVIHENQQQDLSLRQDNNATRQDIAANREQIRDDRQQVHTGRQGDGSS